MSDTALETGVGHLGWRFGLGICLIIGGYAALALIPVVAGADLKLGVKTALTGLLAIAPLLQAGLPWQARARRSMQSPSVRSSSSSDQG